MASGVRIEGLAALQRANSMVQKEVSGKLKDGLKQAAQPVATDAQTLAVQRIRRMTIPWSQMKIGVTRKAVYVAPKKRRSKGNPRLARPNLADLLADRAMKPAVEQNLSEIERQVNVALSDLFDRWARIG